MLEKRVLTILELNWNQRLGHKKTKLSICHHMLTSSTPLQNRSFRVVERTRTSGKCLKMKNAGAKRAKILFFIVKYANLWGFCCSRRRGCLSSLPMKLDVNCQLCGMAKMPRIYKKLSLNWLKSMKYSHQACIQKLKAQLLVCWAVTLIASRHFQTGVPEANKSRP